MFNEYEKKYNVLYPKNEKATYNSLLNYSDDLSTSRQRWYRYKEGYSLELVKKIIREYNNNPEGTILDPFLGSGSTILAANEMGLRGIGFEVNPFSYNLANAKLKNYTIEFCTEFENIIKDITIDKKIPNVEYKLPNLSISKKVFNSNVEEIMMSIKKYILDLDIDEDMRSLLMIGWISNIERLSNYRKAGNGLKKRKYVKPRIITDEDVYNSLNETYISILSDIKINNAKYKSKIYNETSLTFKEKIKKESISGIIFSPPYANCFDYVEIYKLELWFGDFVDSYEELKKLRKQSVRSNLNSDLKSYDMGEETVSNILSQQLDEIKDIKLWDKRIPGMLKLYYQDMFNIIKNSYEVLEDKGFCAIVVGNSAYGGIIFPTDLILAEYADYIGFKVDKIEVDRYIITSSQQYKTTKNNGKYLRESILCLKKM